MEIRNQTINHSPHKPGVDKESSMTAKTLYPVPSTFCINLATLSKVLATVVPNAHSLPSLLFITSATSLLTFIYSVCI